jgi:hypothetical protein
LFLKPFAAEQITSLRSWADGEGGALQPIIRNGTRSLFGISLTSVNKHAMQALDACFWAHALKQGWRELYMGSPMPGFRQALRQDPNLSATDYAHGMRGNVPRDVQLRYYYQKGMQDIVAVLPEYFPHEASMDYGVLLRGDLQRIVEKTSASANTSPYVVKAKFEINDQTAESCA